MCPDCFGNVAKTDSIIIALSNQYDQWCQPGVATKYKFMEVFLLFGYDMEEHGQKTKETESEIYPIWE